MKLTHNDMLVLGNLILTNNLLEPSNDLFEDGLCAGFNGMLSQAARVRDRSSFFKRLNLIEQYKITENQNNFPALIKEINEAKKKVKEKISLSKREEELVDIPAFYEGMLLYLHPDKHPDFFNDQLVNQSDLKTVSSLTKPLSMKGSSTSILLNKTYAFDKPALTIFIRFIAIIR